MGEGQDSETFCSKMQFLYGIFDHSKHLISFFHEIFGKINSQFGKGGWGPLFWKKS